MKPIGLFLACLAFASTAWGGDNLNDLRTADKNGDGLLDRAELIEYFLAHDTKLVGLRDAGLGNPKLKAYAEDLADDALSMQGEVATALRIPDTLFYIERRAFLTAKAEDAKIGWPGLGFSRTLIDSPDPRKSKMDDRALILSFTHDSKRDGKSDSFAVLGTVTVADFSWDWQGGAFQVQPGVDLDVDNSKEAEESSVDFGVNLARYWFNYKADTLLTSQVLSLTPKYGTDRRFDREVYEADLSWSFASLKLLRAGYNTWIGGSQESPDDALFRVYWRPEFSLNAGTVRDAAGNDDLQKIKDADDYLRFGAGGKITIAPLLISDRLGVSLSYKNLTDLDESWNRYYWTAEVDYNIAKNVQFTVLYRKGAKPSSFAETDAVLVGIGIAL